MDIEILPPERPGLPARRDPNDLHADFEPLAPTEQPALVYLANLAPGRSRDTMAASLQILATMLDRPDPAHTPWHRLRFQHTTMLRSELVARYSAATANRILSALRGVLLAAWRLEQIKEADYAKAIDLKRVRGQTLEASAGRALSEDELAGLLHAALADASFIGTRDAAILAVLIFGGLRRAELCGLTMADYDAEALELVVRKGKGNKAREVPLPDDVQPLLADWLTTRGPAPGPLFTRILKGGHITLEQLTGQAIYYIARERAKQAGISEHFTPHDFRRTFAGDLFEGGADASSIQKIMGHSNANTTNGYDRRGKKARKAAIAKRGFKFERRTLPLDD
ncbi:MAG TPA: site-specific integrase [Herpetosiphonaceae bacterium]